MPKNPVGADVNLVITEHTNLVNLYNSLRLAGKRELADACQRAARELETPAVTGHANNTGASGGSTRP